MSKEPECHRFEEEGLHEDDLTDEQRAHVASCAQCSAELEAAQKISAALPRIGELHALRPDARARLWSAIEGEKSAPTPPNRRRFFKSAIVISTLAAAAAILFFLLRPPPPEPLLRFEAIAQNNVVRSGNDLSQGDLLRVLVAKRPAEHSDLRIYRDHTILVARQSGEGPLKLEHKIDAPGAYELVLLVPAKKTPLPEPKSVDEDISAAVTAGIDYQLRELEAR